MYEVHYKAILWMVLRDQHVFSCDECYGLVVGRHQLKIEKLCKEGQEFQDKVMDLMRRAYESVYEGFGMTFYEDFWDKVYDEEDNMS